jgi:hypothetical protein
MLQMLSYCIHSVTITMDENGMDIFRLYLRANSFRGV